MFWSLLQSRDAYPRAVWKSNLPYFLKWGVNRLAILTIFFATGSSESCVKNEVCFTLSDVGVGGRG